MKVVGIHGIGQTFEGGPTEKAEWLAALQGGLEQAGAPGLGNWEFDVVFYGALFRPRGKRAADIPPLNERDIKEDWEKALLKEWWSAAAQLSAENRVGGGVNPTGEDPAIQGPEFQGRGTPELVQRGLLQLSKSRFFRGLGGNRTKRVLIFGLKQVREFLFSPEMKQKILNLVSDKITEDTRIVIGHSLGSIVAYEALCAHPEWKVDTLITLGSPLGIRNLISTR
jgi:hypothetical protein